MNRPAIFVDSTYHTILIALMVIGGFGIVLSFVRAARRYRNRQPPPADIDAWARLFEFERLAGGVGMAGALLFVGALSLLW